MSRHLYEIIQSPLCPLDLLLVAGLIRTIDLQSRFGQPRYFVTEVRRNEKPSCPEITMAFGARNAKDFIEHHRVKFLFPARRPVFAEVTFDPRREVAKHHFHLLEELRRGGRVSLLGFYSTIGALF
jgi:hypothetical protein